MNTYRSVAMLTVGCFVLISVYLLFPNRTHYVPKPIIFDAPLTESPAPTVAKTKERLVLTGDVMLGRHVEYLMDTHGTSYPITGLQDWFAATGTKTVINFESAIAVVHRRTKSGAMQFSTKVDHLPILKEMQIVAASLANNHSLDYGHNGYENTQLQLKKYGIQSFGHAVAFDSNAVAYIEIEDVTVAIVGLHTLFASPTTAEIKTVIDAATAKSDMQIAYVHWGEEYQLVHSAAQETLAHQLIDAGVDLVVGHHPHVTQDVQMYNSVPIFYSLGNFIFDQYFSTDVQEGLLLALTFDQSKYQVSLHPQSSALLHSQPVLLTGEAKGIYLKKLAEKSHPSIVSAITAGVITGELR